MAVKRGVKAKQHPAPKLTLKALAEQVIKQSNDNDACLAACANDWTRLNAKVAEMAQRLDAMAVHADALTVRLNALESQAANESAASGQVWQALRNQMEDYGSQLQLIDAGLKAAIAYTDRHVVEPHGWNRVWQFFAWCCGAHKTGIYERT